MLDPWTEFSMTKQAWLWASILLSVPFIHPHEVSSKRHSPNTEQYDLELQAK